MMDRIELLHQRVLELEDDNCHKALWWTEDIRHLLSELDAAREELAERKAAAGIVGRKVRDLEAENGRLRRVIGKLVAIDAAERSRIGWEGIPANSRVRCKFDLSIGIDETFEVSQLSLTWADGIGEASE